MGTSRHLSLTSLSNTSHTAGIWSAMGPEVDCWVGVGPNGCPSTHLRHGHSQTGHAALKVQRLTECSEGELRFSPECLRIPLNPKLTGNRKLLPSNEKLLGL